MPKECPNCGGILYNLRRVENHPMRDPPRYLAICIKCKREEIY